MALPETLTQLENHLQFNYTYLLNSLGNSDTTGVRMEPLSCTLGEFSDRGQ